MKTASLNPDQFDEFRALVDREIRPEGAATRAWEDFPVILSPGNRAGIVGGFEDGQLAAGAAVLIRQFATSCGTVPVAGIGSVVTRPEFRGRGFSREIQSLVLEKLAAANVPLAVLWTDRPEAYSGRGFRPAGWEFHVDLQGVRPGEGMPSGFRCRPYEDRDAEAVAALYDRHVLRTLRNPGDSRLLYGMPGTRGLVAVGQGDVVAAAVFLGKGADFEGFVPEWSGPQGLVLPLLDEVVRRWRGRFVLVPPGGEALARALSGRGGIARAVTSGYWVVTQPEQLSRYLQGSGHGAPPDPADPAAILGTVGPDGTVVPGILDLAVWGFDSV